MKTTHKIILTAAFLILTLVFLFPARRHPEGIFASGSGTAPRVFLFSRGIYFGQAASGVTPNTYGVNHNPEFWAHLDTTRIALEAFSIISISGALLVITTKKR
jgi:hypothetical protein